ncbi:hypothetical protein AB0H77_27115 [Streptomyces sp. NPDC050844]|uniref:hypothetical protein n=1 Tax=Streptomyces sp. NPDC050844 TaxID=3155790 RepID=UPI0033EE776B
MKLLVLVTLVLVGGLAHAAIRRAPTEDLTPLVRTAVLGLAVLLLGAVVLLAAEPADVPALLDTVLKRL